MRAGSFDSLGLDADRCYDITLGNAWNALVRASEGAPEAVNFFRISKGQ
jgi:hypothetical protein